MLGQTTFAISHDESRYALNGVLFAVQDKELRMVATDGHRLALAMRPAPSAGSAMSGNRPAQGSPGSGPIVGSGEEVEIAISDNQFMIRMPNVLLMARLIEGTFPNYEQVVPRAHPHRVTLSRAALTAALRRVSVLSEERTKPVRFLLTPGQLKLTANSPDYGEAEEQMEAQFAGEEIAIGFNSRYVLDALGAQGGEPGPDRVEGRFEPRRVQKLRGRGNPVCYHAHEDLTPLMGAKIVGN